MTLEMLIDTYGYGALLIGTLLEGETILVIAGFAAHQGYLHLPWVMVCACLGTMAGDQSLFFLGRFEGRRLLQRIPRWATRVDQVQQMLERHQVKLILGFRFMYGVRSAIPFALGMGNVRAGFFIVLNALSAVVWAVLVGAGGYFFGAALEASLGDIKRYEHVVMLMLALLGLCLWLLHCCRRRRRAQATLDDGPPASG